MCPDIRGDRVDGRSEFHSGQFSTRAASTDVPFLDFTGGMMRLLASPAQTRGGYSLIELLVVIAILAILSALMIAGVQKAREAASRLACANNLKQLTLALHQYHGVNGSFPPAAVTSPRLHGWGSFLLEYLEQEALAQEYDRSKHWYAPANQPVVTTELAVMLCPSTPNQDNRMAQGIIRGVSWSAAVGDYSTFRRLSLDVVDDGYVPAPADPAGVLRLNTGTKLTDIGDGSSNTLLL